MKTSEVLIKAKRHLSRARFHGVCYAVTAAVGYNSNDDIKVCKMISDRLGRHTMATHWLAEQVTGSTEIGEHVEWIIEQGPHAIQAWRHAWLDQMIAEFKAKGD